MIRLGDLSVVMRTGSGNRDSALWPDLKGKAPSARLMSENTPGGPDSAAHLATMPFFILVQGSQVVDPVFFDLMVDDELLVGASLHWPARSARNGLSCAHAGLTCQSRELSGVSTLR